MSLLPIITRELRVQARLPSTNRMRWIAAAVVIGIWIGMMLAAGRATAEERAAASFLTMGIACLVLVLLAGVFQTADCLSEERRDGTLGLMFLTDLKGYDVVLGKLVSTSLRSFYTFLAIVPVLAFPFFLGGITAGEFWRVALVLIVTLYVSLAMGMLVSTVSFDARFATAGTFFLLLALCALGPLLAWGTAWNAIFDTLLWFSAPVAFAGAFDAAYSGAPQRFWCGVATLLALGTAGLTISSLLLPHRWRDSVTGRRERNSTTTPFRFVKGRAGLLERRPFLWLVTRDSRPRRIGRVAFAVVMPFWGFLFLLSWPNFNPLQGEAFLVLIVLTYVLHLILKFAVTLEVTRQFSEDRRTGALEILLVSPIPVREMVTAQARAIWNSFRGWALLITVINLAVIWSASRSTFFSRNDESLGYLMLVMLGGIFLLFADGLACVTVGMWQAISKKRHTRAFLSTLQWVLIPPWLVALFFYVIEVAGGGTSALGLPMIFWFFISFMVDICVIVPAQKNLQEHFRTLASVGRIETSGAPSLSPILNPALVNESSPGHYA